MSAKPNGTLLDLLQAVQENYQRCLANPNSGLKRFAAAVQAMQHQANQSPELKRFAAAVQAMQHQANQMGAAMTPVVQEINIQLGAAVASALQEAEQRRMAEQQRADRERAKVNRQNTLKEEARSAGFRL